MTDADADAGTASQPALARALGLSDAVVIGLGSMIGAGVFAAFAPAARGGRRRPADRPRHRGGRRLLQRHRIGPARRAVPDLGRAPTSTVASGSARGGASSPAGASSSARPPAARRWPSPSPPTSRRRTGSVRSPSPPSLALVDGQLPRRHADRPAHPHHRHRGPGRSAPSRSSPSLGGGDPRPGSADGRSPATDAARTASCSRRACSSSPSPATPASRPSARRSATPRAPSRGPSRSRLRCAVAVYAVVAVTVLAVLGADRRRRSPAPLADGRRRRVTGTWAVPVVRVGAAHRRPRRAARPDRRRRPHQRSRWPARATSRAGWRPSTPATACRTAPRSRWPRSSAVLVLTVDLRGAIGFSSFGVLLYYLSPTSPPSPRTGNIAASPARSRSSGARAAPSWSSPCRPVPSSRASPSSPSASATEPYAIDITEALRPETHRETSHPGRA